jgi:hypothetical protein
MGKDLSKVVLCVFMLITYTNSFAKSYIEIDEAIFSKQLSNEYKLSFNTITQAKKLDQNYLVKDAKYLNVKFDSVIIKFNEDLITRKNVALAAEGKCSEMLEKFFTLASRIREAKQDNPMTALKTFTLGNVLLIPPEEIAMEGSEAKPELYFRKDLNGQCRIDFQINPK